MIDMATAIEKLNEFNNKIAEAKQALQQMALQEGKGLVREILQPLFDTGCKQVYWSQYTPYFNDGEPCEFRLHGIRFSMNEDPIVDYVDDDENWYTAWDLIYSIKPFVAPQNTGWRKYTVTEIEEMRAAADARRQAIFDKGFTEESIAQINAAYDLVSNIMEENEALLLMTFGDHVEIVYKETGDPIVSECEHD